MQIDSIASANQFTDGQVRAKVSIGNAYYILFRQLEPAYSYLKEALTYDVDKTDYFLGTISGLYDASYKLAKTDTDSIYQIGIAYIDKIQRSGISEVDSSKIGTFNGVVAGNLRKSGNLTGALELNLKSVT